jgi:hypothetical protein
VWLRVSGAANRRSHLFDVEEALVAGDDLVPLVLHLALGPAARQAGIAGEIACVAPVRPGIPVTEIPLDGAPEVGGAHASFYDDDYLATKRRGVTRKYRKLLEQLPEGQSPERDRRDDEPPAARLVTLDGPRCTVVVKDRILTAASPTPREARGLALHVVRVANDVPFTARYDGHTLRIDPDAEALAHHARSTEATWARVFGAGAIHRDRRALWYLTKYFTPHPPGEPHFFVKPRAFLWTSAGVSSLIEGFHGEGYDVLRGVVATDVFHATPAVFALHGSAGEAIRVPAGTPLIDVLPVPRALLAATYRNLPWRGVVPDALESRPAEVGEEGP